MKPGNQSSITKLWRYINPILFVAVFLVLMGGSIRYFFFAHEWYEVAPPPVANSIVDSSMGIKIVGQRDFVVQVKRSLSLTRDNCPFSFVTTKKYVGVIQESATVTWMSVNSTPPACLLARREAFTSVPWCAAAIAHETCHSKLYNDYRTRVGKPVPLWIDAGPAAEHQCLRSELPVLEFLDAPQRDIDFVRQGDVSYSMRRGDVSFIFKDS